MTEQILRGIQEKQSTGTLRPNELDHSGLTLLHRSAFNGQLLCVKCLISYGADVNTRSKEGLTAAHYAAAGGHLPILQYLYDRDKNSVAVKNEEDLTPLYIAAQEGQLDCLIWLNKYTKSIKTTVGVQKMNPALVAAQEGRLDCLRYLLRVERCLATEIDQDGHTALHYAAVEGHSRVIKWLIDHCNINGGVQSHSGQTALHLASIGGHASAVEVLSKCGVSLSIMDENGKTALDYAYRSQECYQLLQKKMAAVFDGDDDSSEKKVRFDEIIQTYDTFPTHHHATSFENKNLRRKGRSGIFWDDDLQAEFDTWRASPKLTNKRKKVNQNPAHLCKGQSAILRKVSNEHHQKISENMTLRTSENHSGNNTRTDENSSENNNTSFEKPDILKHLDEEMKSGNSSVGSTKSKILTPDDAKTPPPVPARISVRRMSKQKRFKVTDENMMNSLKRYHSIDIGEAFHELEKQQESSNYSNVTTPTTPDSINSTVSGIEENVEKLYTPTSYVQRNQEPPPPPVRKNSANSRKKLLEQQQQELLKSEQVKQKLSSHTQLTEPSGKLPPTASFAQSSSALLTVKGYNAPAKVHATPMLRPRYKSMIQAEEAQQGRDATYDANFRRSKSFSTADLSVDSVVQPSFTNYLREIQPTRDVTDLPKPHHNKGRNQNENPNLFTPTKRLFTQKKKRLPSIFRGITSFFNAVRQKKTEDPYQDYFESSTLGTLGRHQQKKNVFNNFTMPRSSRKGLDELFDSPAPQGVYTSHSLDRLVASPQSEYTKRRNSSKVNPVNIGFNNRNYDKSLRGTNQYVKEMEQNLNADDYFPMNDNNEPKNIPIGGRMKDNSNTRKERVNAFIW